MSIMQREYIYKHMILMFILIMLLGSCSANNELWTYRIEFTGDWKFYNNHIQEYNSVYIVKDKAVFTYASGGEKDGNDTRFSHGGIHVLDKKSGILQWKLDNGISPLLITDTQLITREANYFTFVDSFKNNSTTLSAFELLTGEKKWSFTADLIFNFSAFKDSIFINCVMNDKQYLSVLNRQEGNLLWKAEYEAHPVYEPCIAGEKLFIPELGPKTGITILDANTGSLLKKIETPFAGYLIPDNGIVVAQAGTEEKGYTGIDTENYNILWKISDFRWDIALPKPLCYKNICYIISFDEYAAFKVKTGEILWQQKIKDNESGMFPRIPFKIINGYLYRAAVDKKYIEKRDLLTGSLLGRIKINQPIHSPFTYDDGVIYYRSKGIVYAEKIKL